LSPWFRNRKSLCFSGSWRVNLLAETRKPPFLGL
jgi:hypothetical protein